MFWSISLPELAWKKSKQTSFYQSVLYLNMFLVKYPNEKESLHSCSPQMHCSLDSGLVVVVFIVCCLLWVVGLLLFHDFGNICDRAAAKINDSTSMVRMIYPPKSSSCQKSITAKLPHSFMSLIVNINGE